MGKTGLLLLLVALVCWLSTLSILQHRTIALQKESIALLNERVALLSINNDLCSVTLENQAHMHAKTKRVAESCLETFDETFAGLGLDLPKRPKFDPSLRLATKSLRGKEGGIGPVGATP